MNTFKMQTLNCLAQPWYDPDNGEIFSRVCVLLPNMWFLQDSYNPLNSVHCDTLLKTAQTCQSKEAKMPIRISVLHEKWCIHQIKSFLHALLLLLFNNRNPLQRVTCNSKPLCCVHIKHWKHSSLPSHLCQIVLSSVRWEAPAEVWQSPGALSTGKKRESNVSLCSLNTVVTPFSVWINSVHTEFGC